METEQVVISGLGDVAGKGGGANLDLTVESSSSGEKVPVINKTPVLDDARTAEMAVPTKRMLKLHTEFASDTAYFLGPQMIHILQKQQYKKNVVIRLRR